MNTQKNNQISRKGFFKKVSAGFLSFSLFRRERIIVLDSHTEEGQTSPQNRQLGRTGIKVTPVCFGASRTMEPILLKGALDTGINFLDTGRSYFNGQNEVMVGKVLQGIRKEVIIQSKISINRRAIGTDLDSAEASGRIIKLMQSSLDKSLEALQTDYIDVLMIHGANSVDIISHDAVLEFLHSAKEKGQIRAHGFSSHSNQIELLKAANDSKSYDVIMVPYNHKGAYTHSMSGSYSEWDQNALEKELVKAESNNIGIVAMKTCSGGPYAFEGEDQPSYRAALKWILNHSYIASMATAMGNLNELNEDVQVM
ncbi:aldo/keto reductase [Candidatus Neomarinimicrobiota bacterium]